MNQSVNVYVVESVAGGLLGGDGTAYRLLTDARAGAQERAKAGGVAVVGRVPFAGALGSIVVGALNAAATVRGSTMLEVWGPGDATGVTGGHTEYAPTRRWSDDDGGDAFDAALAAGGPA